MAITTTGSSQLGALLESNGPSTPRPTAAIAAEYTEFKDVMVEALPAQAPLPSGAPVDAAQAPLPSHISPFVPPPGSGPAASPVLVPVSGPSDLPSIILNQPTTPELGRRSEAAVRAALDAAGIDHSGFSFKYWEAVQWFPGAPWIHYGLDVTVSDGRTYSFGADVAERYPHITARNIQEYLSGQNS